MDGYNLSISVLCFKGNNLNSVLGLQMGKF